MALLLSRKYKNIATKYGTTANVYSRSGGDSTFLILTVVEALCERYTLSHKLLKIGRKWLKLF